MAQHLQHTAQTSGSGHHFGSVVEKIPVTVYTSSHAASHAVAHEIAALIRERAAQG